MTKFFLEIYDFLAERRWLMWLLLGVSVASMALAALQLKFHTDISSFVPDSAQNENKEVLANLKIKDRIIVMFSAKNDEISPDELIEAADVFESELWQRTDSAHVLALDAVVDVSVVSRTIDYVYENLPVFLDENDYMALDSLLQPQVCEQRMAENFETLLSPMGMGVQDVVLRDPLGLGGRMLQNLQNFNQFGGYTIYDDRLFSEDYTTLFVFIDSQDGSNASQLNDELTTAIEESLSAVNKQTDDVVAECYGVPIISVYNARQIQRDLMVTMNVALLIIILVILLAFRRKRTVFLLLTPVIYGALFAAACVSLIQGQISAIAIGTGAVVLGVALSYSIHVISHASHCVSVRQIIEELAYPLTVGSITTIGAFIGLQFTSSPLLQDFGLFAACSLIGTTLFCLIFLPHFLAVDGNETKRHTMQFINKINAYQYDKNKWLVAGLIVVTIVSLFFCNSVGFNTDMMQFYYRPEHLESAGNRLQSRPDEDKSVLFITHSADVEQALTDYATTHQLVGDANVEKQMSAAEFLPSQALQRERIERWNSFWTDAKIAVAKQTITNSAVRVGFDSEAFNDFFALLDKQYESKDLLQQCANESYVFSSLVENNASEAYLLTQIWLDESQKSDLYTAVLHTANVVDQSFFIAEVARSINDDFNLILWMSSLLIFVVLLVSYGRIELAILAFLPMFLSWFIILGFMAIFGIEFNIVNIILSSFIFGIGDDFSIFVLDGLCSEYREGKRMLPAHKTAIFFSALMTVVGMGALLFAKHPAIHSLALVSLLGIVVVVLVAYVLQPLLFRCLVTSQISKDGIPHTLWSLLRSILVLLTVTFCCLLLDVLIVCLLFVPCKMSTKQRLFKRVMQKIALWPIRVAPGLHITINRNGETFEKPAILIANHQSMIDLLVMMSLTPNSAMMAQDWVLSNPFFALIAKFCGFIGASSGFSEADSKMPEILEQGLSLVIFPEGTRSMDLEVQRFRKGAFYLAEKYNLDIVPMVMYGTGQAYHKKQLYINCGEMYVDVLPRITPDNREFGDTYQERSKKVRSYIIQKTEEQRDKYDNMDNAFFRTAFDYNWIYKDIDVERMQRRNTRINRYYRWLDELVPRTARVVELDGGYSEKSFALALLSRKRQILAIDADDAKVVFAQHYLLVGARFQTMCADSSVVALQEANVFIINKFSQNLFDKCAEKLAVGGKIIVMKPTENLPISTTFEQTENEFATIFSKN